MKATEIMSFINPFSDALSATFFIILICASISAIVWLMLTAKPESWEKKWYGGDLDDVSNDLDNEHGSIHELSTAVATKAEKVAEMIPSMILVFGLLGTFLGLGMALNHASNVLVNANSTGMDGAMSQLMGMMEGLGAKFKTSTWGILLFITLSILLNALGFNEKRLEWVVKKVRKEAEIKKSKQLKHQEQQDQRLIDTLHSIEKSNSDHSDQLATNMETVFNIVNDNQKLLIQEVSKIVTITQNNFKEQVENLAQFEARHQKSQKQLLEGFDKSAIDSLEELKKIAEYNYTTQKSMQHFVDSTVTSMSSIGTSADKMAEAAHAVGESAHELNNVVDGLQVELKGVMATIKKDLGSTIDKMGKSFEGNMASMSNSMNQATQGISTSVTQLSNSVDNTLQQVTTVIGESMELQRKSGQEFTLTSNMLNGQVGEMTNLINQLSSDIKSGLESIGTNSARMRKLVPAFEKVVNNDNEVVFKIDQLVQSMATTQTKLIDVTEQTNQHLKNLLNKKAV